MTLTENRKRMALRLIKTKGHCTNTHILCNECPINLPVRDLPSLSSCAHIPYEEIRIRAISWLIENGFKDDLFEELLNE